MKSTGRQMLESLVFSMILSAIIIGLSQIPGAERFIHSGIWGILIFSALLGLLVSFIAGWGISTFDAQSRPNIFLGITALRMLLSMIFIGVVLFTGIEDRIVWVADFFGVYLFYLVFEIVSILSNLRAISAEGEKS
jgi:ABC-type glycerol-3-phosphate transport system permease component